MWNDTDIPLAYLITFRTYGTWLHGDIRGTVDRNHNVYGTPRLEHEPARKEFVKTLSKHEPVTLDGHRRSAVIEAIRETCAFRCWELHAINVRTNHVHVVVTARDKKPELIMNAFKANSTRQMRLAGVWNNDLTPWAEKGSKRRLWNEQSVAKAVDYVLNGQGDDLPQFD